VSRPVQVRTILACTSQRWRGAGLHSVLATPELELCSTPSTSSPKSRSLAWQRSEDNAGYRRAWFSYSLLSQPDAWQTTTKDSIVVWLRWRPYRDTLQKERFRREPSLPYFPCSPSVTRSVLVPRPAARRCSASPLRAPCGSGFPNKNLPSAAALTGEIFLRSLRRKHISALGAGHLTSLRAGVSRGQSGQIQTGEQRWHSTKTTSL
jgi:hypothetical protein